MMPIEKTLQAYKNEKLNCAQSILRGFQDKKAVAEDKILAARALGGGRAPEGLCGALYAAMELAKSPDSSKTLADAFIQNAGSDKCREIRKLGKLTCEGCVRLAAEQLARVIDPT
jgi:hypothetical protein